MESAFKAQILDDAAHGAEYKSHEAQQAAETPDKRILTSTFEKMRAHFDCLAEIEASHGSLTDNARLREALRQNAFLLGLEACKNKSNAMELAQI